MKAIVLNITVGILCFCILIACTGEQLEEGALSSCGAETAVFSHRIISDEEMPSVTPLGTINPSHHTFPTAHMYPQLVDDQGTTLYAPANVTITSVSRQVYTQSNFRQGFADYSMTVQPCAEIRMTFGHIVTLNPQIAAALSPMNNCITRSTTTETVEECFSNTPVAVAVGSELGTVGHPGMSSGFDWGLTDSRVNNFLANPDRQQHYVHVACPIDYFVTALKAELESKTGRSEAPVCGEVTYDVADTAQGIWIREDTPVDAYLDGYGLTLGKDHLNPLQYTIAAGQIGGAFASRTYYFTPQASGLIERDFAEITADGNIYCFEDWNMTIILQLQNDGSLLFEADVPNSCLMGGHSFSADAIRFIR